MIGSFFSLTLTRARVARTSSSRHAQRSNTQVTQLVSQLSSKLELELGVPATSDREAIHGSACIYRARQGRTAHTDAGLRGPLAEPPLVPLDELGEPPQLGRLRRLHTAR